MRKLCAALALYAGMTAVFVQATARADDVDDQYLSALAGLGINTAQAPQLITAAHTVCASKGNPIQGLNAQRQFLAAGIQRAQMNPVIIAGARAYCPDKLHSAGLS